jgi:serine/threonine protein kinase
MKCNSCTQTTRLTGHKLFGGSTTSMIKYHNEQGNMDLSSSKINALERDLLSKMLSSSTADRLSAKQALQHAYFGTDISSPTNNEVTRADLDVCSPRIQKVGVITDDSIVFVKDSPVCKNGP